MDLFDLSHKNALVIGSGGIGGAIAKGLAGQGASVLIADIRQENLDGTLEEMKRDGLTARTALADIDKKGEIPALFETVAREFETLDILVNSAGIGAFSSALDMTGDVWYRVLDHFLSNVFWCCQAGGRIMIPQKSGKIINVCSMSGMVVTGDLGSSYGAAKAGLIQLTRALASEWVRHGVHVNAISPGMVRTDLTAPMFEDNPQAVEEMNALIPMGRMAQPIDMVGPALFLASAASDYVIGQNIVADGGYTLV